MSIRCVWIVSIAPECVGKVLFFRTFSSVEKRAQQSLAENFVNIPSECEFSMSLLTSLGLSQDSKQFVDRRDKSSKNMHLPVLAIKIKDKELWPIVVVEQAADLLCCLPYVEDSRNTRDLSYSSRCSISVAFSALIGILSCLRSSTALGEENTHQHRELNNYLNLNMPFGEPSENSSLLSLNLPTHGKKGKSSGSSAVYFEIKEYIRCIQTDCQESASHAGLYGSINVKLEFASHFIELRLTLEHRANGKLLDLESTVLHPCVQNFMGLDSLAPNKFWFVPTLNQFTLSFYTASVSQLPILGVFKLKGKSSIELLVQLKLNEGVNNSFISCEVIIPFLTSETISNFEYKSTQGTLQVSTEKNSLKWIIGAKFIPKTLDAFLTAKVSLNQNSAPGNEDSTSFSKKAFAQINFKQKESLSGCTIDVKSVALSPHQKLKVLMDSSVQSTEYKIMNSFGDPPLPTLSLEKYLQY